MYQTKKTHVKLVWQHVPTLDVGNRRSAPAEVTGFNLLEDADLRPRQGLTPKNCEILAKQLSHCQIAAYAAFAKSLTRSLVERCTWATPGFVCSSTVSNRLDSKPVRWRLRCAKSYQNSKYYFKFFLNDSVQERHYTGLRSS